MGCSQLGASGFAMGEVHVMLQCCLSSLCGWARTLYGLGLFLIGYQLLGRVTIRDFRQFGHC